MICPSCAHDNIAGDDLCAHCGMDLAGLETVDFGVDPDDPILATKMRDLPLKRALTVEEGAMVSDALLLMCKHREGCIFVTNPIGGLEGVFTECDVSKSVVSRGLDPKTTPITEVMMNDPYCLDQDDPLAWALHRMGVDGYRHLPVLDDDRRLVGFLSARAVLRVLQVA